MPGQLARALEKLREGGMVVVCDDPDREDEGDVCMAAELVTAEAIAFMACNARGLICLSLPEERCDELDLPLMVPANAGSDVTGFTVSIEAATGVTTGISAADRARTIRVAVDSESGPSSSASTSGVRSAGFSSTLKNLTRSTYRPRSSRAT